MNIVIAGSRDFNDYELLELTITKWAEEQTELKQEDITIISGNARGADKLGERFAKEYSLKLKVYPADWNQYGKSAGYIRNKIMASVSDVAFIFWDGQSKGTKHMIDLCNQYPTIELHVLNYKDDLHFIYNNKAPWE